MSYGSAATKAQQAGINIQSPWMPVRTNWLRFCSEGTTKAFDRGSVIVRPGDLVDRLYVIVRGNLKYSIYSPDGCSKTLAILQQGGLFGEGPALSEPIHSCFSVEAVTDAEVCTFDPATAMKLVMDNEDLLKDTINSLCMKFVAASRQIEDMAFRSVKQRLASLFYTFLISGGGNTNTIVIELTHSELADLVGCGRVAATRALQELQEEGLIHVGRGSIFLQSKQGLFTTAYPQYEEDGGSEASIG